MKLLCLSFLIISVNAFHVGNDEAKPRYEKIVGGVTATIYNLPYQAEIRLNNIPICGAAIISDTWLLTAGHCVQVSSCGIWSIVTILDDKSKGSYDHEIKRMIRHPEYNSTNSYNDIALIELAEPMVFYPFRKPIALSTKSPKTGDTMVISGFGKTGQYLDYPLHLQMANVTVVDYALCTQKYKEDPIAETMFCAGNGTAGICMGDSGSPGVINGELAGIISNSMSCGSIEYPGVYTDVYRYRNWIEQYVKLPKKN